MSPTASTHSQWQVTGWPFPIHLSEIKRRWDRTKGRTLSSFRPAFQCQGSDVSSVRAYSTCPHAYVPSGCILSYTLFEQKLKEMISAVTMIWYDRIHYNNGVNRMLRENKQEGSRETAEKSLFSSQRRHTQWLSDCDPQISSISITRKLVEMQILRPHTRFTESGSPGCSRAVCFHKLHGILTHPRYQNYVYWSG